MEVVPVQFIGRGKYGDFAWMIESEEYEDGLFLFNDNEEQHLSAVRGAGNAVIRPYNRLGSRSFVRSAGVITGTLGKGGYTVLNDHAKEQIDACFAEIVTLLRSDKYRRIFYSADGDGTLGTSIFFVDPAVVNYITNKIRSLPSCV
jgi:hypothetical protein